MMTNTTIYNNTLKWYTTTMIMIMIIIKGGGLLPGYVKLPVRVLGGASPPRTPPSICFSIWYSWFWNPRSDTKLRRILLRNNCITRYAIRVVVTARRVPRDLTQSVITEYQWLRCDPYEFEADLTSQKLQHATRVVVTARRVPRDLTQNRIHIQPSQKTLSIIT